MKKHKTVVKQMIGAHHCADCARRYDAGTYYKGKLGLALPIVCGDVCDEGGLSLGLHCGIKRPIPLSRRPSARG